jgi:glycosyltransferase involved in cell wall biosynthesis
MEAVVSNMAGAYEIIFCLDPAPDGTEEVILQEINRNPNIRLLVFSRRFGQPAATVAGLLMCRGASCVVIDVDLQDPPELIPDMYSKLQEGYEVVYAKRRSRKGETLAKRVVSKIGYWSIAKLSEVEIPRDTGDFRIMTRRVIEELRCLHETQSLYWFAQNWVQWLGKFQQQTPTVDVHRGRALRWTEFSFGSLVCFPEAHRCRANARITHYRAGHYLFLGCPAFILGADW